MRKIFTILCVMAFSNTFGVDADCTEENPTEEECKAALQELRERVELDEEDLETLDRITADWLGLEEMPIIKSLRFDSSARFPPDLYVLDKYSGDIEPLHPEDFRYLNQKLSSPHEFIKVKSLSVNPYINWPYYKVVEYKETCKIQMDGFLKRAMNATDDIWSTNIKNSVNSVIWGGITTLAFTKDPKAVVVASILSGVASFCSKSYDSATEVYYNLEAAHSWAKALDQCQEVIDSKK